MPLLSDVFGFPTSFSLRIVLIIAGGSHAYLSLLKLCTFYPPRGVKMSHVFLRKIYMRLLLYEFFGGDKLPPYLYLPPFHPVSLSDDVYPV